MGNTNSQQKKQQHVPIAIGEQESLRDSCIAAALKGRPTVIDHSHEYATFVFHDYESDTESGLDCSRGVFIQGTYESWQYALYNLWLAYGTFRHGYVAVRKDGKYQKDCSQEIKTEWNRLLAHQELTQKLEAIKRDRVHRKAEQQACLHDLKQTIDIIEAPDRIPFGQQKLGFAKRHLHNLLDFTYNESLWNDDADLASNIHRQILRCRNLPDYAHKAQHGLPAAESEDELSGHEPDSDTESDHIVVH